MTVISDNVNAISVQTRGVIGDLSTNLDVISQNLKDMTGSLKNTQGLAKRLLDPQGSIDTFLNDSNELYNQVDSALKNVNAITAQLKSFADFINGTRPQVTRILEKGSDTLTSAKDVLEAAKNNPLLKGGVPARPAQGAPDVQLPGRELLMRAGPARGRAAFALRRGCWSCSPAPPPRSRPTRSSR